MTERERRVLEAIDAEGALALLRELIRLPSENPPGGEEAKARCLLAYFGRHGISCRQEEVLPGRPNVVAELGSRARPALVFNGHIDTVPAGEGWTLDPFGAELRDGRVYGRGACDMLAGVAAMSAAAVALRASGVELGGRLLVHACIDEEGSGRGSRHAARDLDADWVIVTEATDGQLMTRGKGQLNVELAFRGAAAHSSRPQHGRNAIADAAAFVAAVELENARAAASPDPVVGPVTYSAGLVSGGSSASIVPAECVLTVDRRVLPTETIAEAEADVRRLLERVAAERPGLEARIETTLAFPPLRPLADEHVLPRAVLGACRRLGRDLAVGGFVGATDAAWYAARGIPAVIFGPGDPAPAHQPDEFVAAEEVGRCTEALALSAAELLAP